MKVCVITGGAGGMGVECAKIMGKREKLLLVDVSAEKLEAAVSEISECGIEGVETAVCDITDRDQVKALAQQAAALGEVNSLGLHGMAQGHACRLLSFWAEFFSAKSKDPPEIPPHKIAGPASRRSRRGRVCPLGAYWAFLENLALSPLEDSQLRMEPLILQVAVAPEESFSSRPLASPVQVPCISTLPAFTN